MAYNMENHTLESSVFSLRADERPSDSGVNTLTCSGYSGITLDENFKTSFRKRQFDVSMLPLRERLQRIQAQQLLDQLDRAQKPRWRNWLDVLSHF